MDVTKIFLTLTGLLLLGLVDLFSTNITHDLQNGDTYKLLYDIVNNGSAIIAYCVAAYLVYNEHERWKNDKPRRERKQRSKRFIDEMKSIAD